MLEVAFPAGAEIRMAGMAGCVGDEARSRTVTVAGKAPFARFALRSEGFALVLSELALFGAVNHFGQRLFVQIAELKFRENIVVAGINVAVVFHCGGVSASFGHGAQTSRHAHPSGQRGIEQLHEERAHIAAHPFVEERAEKFAPGFRPHTEGGHFGGGEPFDGRSQQPSVGMTVKALDNWGELQEIAANSFEKAVEFEGLAHVEVVHHGHGVPFHTVPRQEFHAVHYLPPGAAPRSREAVAIVHLFGAIDGDAHQKVVVGQKSAPVIGEQRAVGLQGIVDVLAGCVLLLQRQRLLVERPRAHQRFAAVPGEKHVVAGLNGDVIVDIPLERLVAHLLFGRLRVEFLFFEVVTIGTVQVAGRTGRLGHDVYGVHETEK